MERWVTCYLGSEMEKRLPCYITLEFIIHTVDIK